MKHFMPLITMGVILIVAGCTTFPADTQTPAPSQSLISSGTPVASPTSVSVSETYPWWNDDVFYEIFVRSFFDSNGDGIGDFKGLTSKLDYLNDGDPTSTDDLGITGIWLMPIFPSPSYHGYDVTDYFGINPQYGTMDDFKNFLAEAHKRNIHVIIDLVLNHTSDQHPWFQQAVANPNSPYRSWYIWSETNPGYRGPWDETVWHPSPTGYYYGIFVSTMPDLNYENPAVTQEMEKVVRFWLEDIGVDGFRLDAAKHLIEDGAKQQNTTATHQWYTAFRPLYKAINPQAMTVGEINGDDLLNLATYLNGDQLDLAFDFGLARAFINSITQRAAISTTSQLQYAEKFLPPNQYATFLTNHDQVRLLSQLAGNVDRAKVAASLLLTAPGVPFVYYGEEIGMQGTKPDELIRRPMQWTTETNAGFSPSTPWEPLDPDYPKFNVASESNDPFSLLNHYRALIHLRNESAALRLGNIDVVRNSNSRIYSILRIRQNEAILVLVNLTGNTISSFTLSLDKSTLPSGVYQLQSLFGKASFPDLTLDSTGGFSGYFPAYEIPAYGTIILQLIRIPVSQ
jgi:alpha-amylase